MSCKLNSEIGCMLSVAWGYHGTEAPAPGLSLVRACGVCRLSSAQWHKSSLVPPCSPPIFLSLICHKLVLV